MRMPMPTAHVRRQIAVTATRDERSVKRYYRGEPLRQLSELSIRAAIRELGLPDPRPEAHP